VRAFEEGRGEGDLTEGNQCPWGHLREKEYVKEDWEKKKKQKQKLPFYKHLMRGKKSQNGGVGIMN